MAKKARKQAPKRAQKPMQPASFSAQDVKLTQDIKRANQRLRELEKQGLINSPAYKAAERLAMIGDKAMSTGIHTENKGKPNETKTKVIKFNTNVRSLNYNQRRHLQAEVERFLSAESSTSKGARAIVERARKAYNEKAKKEYGKNIGADEWLNIWEAGIVKQYKLLYGSDETFSLVIELKASPLDMDGAITFMQNMYGKPIAEIHEAVPHKDMDKGTTEPWSWDDIFTAGEDEDKFTPPGSENIPF